MMNKYEITKKENDRIIIKIGNTVIDIAPDVHDQNAPFIEIYPWDYLDDYGYTAIDRRSGEDVYIKKTIT